MEKFVHMANILQTSSVYASIVNHIVLLFKLHMVFVFNINFVDLCMVASMFQGASSLVLNYCITHVKNFMIF